MKKSKVNEPEIEKKTKKSGIRKIIDIISTVLVGLVVAFAIVFQVTSIVTRNDNYGVANFFGYQTLVVAADSMEPDYMVGTGLIVQKVDPSEIKVGDDLTFFDDGGTNYVMTHRCIEIRSTVDNGETYYTFICHGINTESEFCKDSDGVKGDCTWQKQAVEQKYLIGKVIANNDALGGFYTFLTSIWGLIVLILIPGLFLIISSIVDVVRSAKQGDSPALESSAGSIDISKLSKEDRDRLKQELLDEIVNEKTTSKSKTKGGKK